MRVKRFTRSKGRYRALERLAHAEVIQGPGGDHTAGATLEIAVRQNEADLTTREVIVIRLTAQDRRNLIFALTPRAGACPWKAAQITGGKVLENQVEEP